MLAHVKTPPIDIFLRRERIDELLDWIRQKYEVQIVVPESSESTLGSVAIEQTDFWKEMQGNRTGNLLAAARLKARLSQAQLAEKVQVHRNTISAWELGRRKLSPALAQQIANVLNIRLECLL